MSRIQKYKIYRNEYIASATIFCDFKKRCVSTLECGTCEHWVSVHPDREEIICNAELTETA